MLIVGAQEDEIDGLSKMFSQIFTMAEFDPTHHDPLKAVRKLVKMQKGETKKQIFETQQILEKMRKTIKRLHKKGKDQKAGKLQRVLEALEQSAVAEEEKAKRTIRVCDKVLAILDDHDYEVDKPKAKPPAEGLTSEIVSELIRGSMKSLHERMERESAQRTKQPEPPRG